ncbi:hypothetical protein PsorP6_014800 [Peronosclerospora sorghi]|uniref:Uncharacterized protein n=1 Tax=Peronosclerospora sorghi TaxID=230839 RepID=A0ACC0VUV1_9STRA|nr:hypothetical protein PsorP6_014800 [Peronosclerospora sorghi]
MAKEVFAQFSRPNKLAAELKDAQKLLNCAQRKIATIAKTRFSTATDLLRLLLDNRVALQYLASEVSGLKPAHQKRVESLNRDKFKVQTDDMDPVMAACMLEVYEDVMQFDEEEMKPDVTAEYLGLENSLREENSAYSSSGASAGPTCL